MFPGSCLDSNSACWDWHFRVRTKAYNRGAPLSRRPVPIFSKACDPRRVATVNLRHVDESLMLLGTALSAASVLCFLIATPALCMLQDAAMIDIGYDEAAAKDARRRIICSLLGILRKADSSLRSG